MSTINVVLFAFLIPEQTECMHASYHESTQVSYSKIRISLTFLIKVNDTELHMVNSICFLSGEGALIITISNQ